MVGLNPLNNKIEKNALLNSEEHKFGSIQNKLNQRVTKREQLEQIAKDYESVFVGKMLNIMWEEVKMNPISDENSQGRIYKNMFIDEIAKEISKTGKLAISETILRQLIKYQEVNQNEQQAKIKTKQQ
jgi:Rod binding domain-containing protein